jgi:hypothetical protein
LKSTGSLTIDKFSLGFFQDIYPSAQKQTYKGKAMTPILEAMRTYGDGFVKIIEVNETLQPSADTGTDANMY